jgi:hypothetical protein
MAAGKADLLKKNFKVNQIRNAVFAYVRYLKVDKKKQKEEIAALLKEMGHKIALTYAQYWKPTFKDSLDLLRDIHRSVFKTAARVRQTDSEISVVSHGCPLDKYHYEDIDVAGDNIIIGFIETFFEILAQSHPELPKIKGTSKTSRTLGDNKCEYSFKMG